MSIKSSTFGADQKTIEDCERDAAVFVAAFHKAIEDAGIVWATQRFKVNLDFDNQSFPVMWMDVELVACKRKVTK